MFIPRTVYEQMLEHSHDMSMSMDLDEAIQGRAKKKMLQAVWEFCEDERNRDSNAGSTAVNLMYVLINLSIVYTMSLAKPGPVFEKLKTLRYLEESMIKFVKNDISSLESALLQDQADIWS